MTEKTATTATATTATEKKTRNRKPSAFAPRVRVTISTHADIGPISATEVGEALTAYYGADHAVRTVSRTRAAKKGTARNANAPANLMVYVAPQGFTWAASAERGVRLDAETANLLRAAAEKLGVPADDPAALIAVAKALASNVLGK